MKGLWVLDRLVPHRPNIPQPLPLVLKLGSEAKPQFWFLWHLWLYIYDVTTLGAHSPSPYTCRSSANIDMYYCQRIKKKKKRRKRTKKEENIENTYMMMMTRVNNWKIAENDKIWGKAQKMAEVWKTQKIEAWHKTQKYGGSVKTQTIWQIWGLRNYNGQESGGKRYS